MGYFQDKLEKLERAKAKYGDDADLSPMLASRTISKPDEPVNSKLEKYDTGSGKHYQMIDPAVTESERTFGSKEDVWTPLSERARITKPAKELMGKVWSKEGQANQEQNMLAIAGLNEDVDKFDWENGFMASNPSGENWTDESPTPRGYTNSRERAMYALNNTGDFKTMKAIGKNPTSFFGVLKDVSVMKGAQFTGDEVQKINDMIEKSYAASDTYWGVYWDKDRQSLTPETDLITEDIGSSYSKREKPVYKYEFSEDVNIVGEEDSSAYLGEVEGTWNIRRTPTNVSNPSRKDKLTTNEVYKSKKAYDERVMQIREVQYDTAKKTGNLDVFMNAVQDIEKFPFVSQNDKKVFYQNKINRGQVSVEDAVQKSGGNVKEFNLSYKQKHNYYRSQVIGGFMTPKAASEASGISVKNLDINPPKKKKKKLFGIL